MSREYPFHLLLLSLGIAPIGSQRLTSNFVRSCVVDFAYRRSIKKVTRVFERDVLARRALREVAVLRHIGVCDNVTALLDFDTTFIDFSEIYLVLSASEADLSQIIRSGQALSDAHLQYFVAQILRGVRYMHAAKIVHRDLKPGNLLVNADCALRLCDFGLARAYADPAADYDIPANCDMDGTGDAAVATERLDRRRDSAPTSTSDRATRSLERAPGRERSSPPVSRSLSPPKSSLRLSSIHRNDPKAKQRRLNYPGGPLTEYVATRWYRAPEVMLCFREGYGPELDMWSVGCILAELIAGKPIFAGKDYVDQIARIHNVLGSPSEAVINKIGSERAKTFVKSLPNTPAVPFQRLYPNAAPEALDLLSKLLTWDPAERLSADEALRHPWLKAYHESNARWEAPPAFDKFAEVEFIRSLREFKSGLQRESDELRLELEVLEQEEAEQFGDEHPGAIDSDGNRVDEEIMAEPGQDRPDPDATNPSGTDAGSIVTNATGEKATQPEDTQASPSSQGNGLRADADQSPMSSEDDQLQPARKQSDDSGSALSCSNSTHSCHLPASVLSPGSIARTPSSTSTSSADEAGPPSPGTFDQSCRLSSLKESVNTLADAKMMAAAPAPTSFFRLGHEEEGRRESFPIPDKDASFDDVFMPASELLRVAQGLVDHQVASAAAALAAAVAGEKPLAPSGASVLHERSSESYGPKLDRADAAVASLVADEKAGVQRGSQQQQQSSKPGRGASLSQRSGSTASSSSGSTPSLGQGLLDNVNVTPASGSSSNVTSLSSHRQSKQLIILQDGLMQSCAGLVAEIIGRNSLKGHPTLLLSALHGASTYLQQARLDTVTVLDATSYCAGYGPDSDDQGLSLKSCRRVAEAVVAKLDALQAQSRLTIVIDSLDTIAEQSEDGIEGAYTLVRTVLATMNAYSRLIVGVQNDAPAVSSALLSAFNSPLVWGSTFRRSSADADGASAAASGTIITARLHPPAVMRFIHRNYGLRPPSTSAAVARALASEYSHTEAASAGADDVSGDDAADARFWDLLRSISNRGALGIPSHEAGGGTGGWWADGSILADEVECIFKASNQAASASGTRGGASALPTQHANKICFQDLVGSASQDGSNAGRPPSSNGWGFLELRYQARSGKVHEELIGCMTEAVTAPETGRRFRLCPLDMADRRSQNAAVVGASTAPMPSATTAQQSAASTLAADPHSSMMSGLSFNLGETDQQRARREEVPLPYAYHQSTGAGASAASMRGSTGNSTIFFEPEAGDDEDDEDPDDDLDL